MLKKIIILLLLLLGLAAVGYYILYTEGAFQTKEDVYKKTDSSSSSEMKCEAGKCGAAMQKSDSNITPTKKCGNN